MTYQISPSSLAQPVVIVSPLVADGTSGSSARGVPVTDTTSSTSAITAVASAAIDTVILAANTARRGASIYNSDANPLQILLGSGVSTATNFSAQIASGGYYEVPFGYSGAIKGIWTLDGAGFAHVTEFV